MNRHAASYILGLAAVFAAAAAVAAEQPGGTSTMGIGQSYVGGAPPVIQPAAAPNAPPAETEDELPPGSPAPSPEPGNFEGVWKPDFLVPLVDSALGTSGSLVTIERTLPPYTADGANIFWHRVMMEQRGTPVANSPSLYLPSIPVNALTLFLGPMSIIQNKDDFVIFFESGSQWRIRMNGRPPKDLKPTYEGYSSGRWEGATLVVESTGFNTKTWLDSVGSPHSEQLRIVTRITKINNGRKLEFLTTFDDPKMYSKPFTVRRTASWRPDLRMLEVEIENMRPENNSNLVIED